MSGIWKGALLGIVNVLVIGVGIAAFDVDPDSGRHFEAGLVVLVIIYGGLPGLFGGAALGLLADLLNHLPRVVRMLILTLPALGLVYGLARMFHLLELAPVSCIPTVVAALILERWTRRPADPPPVPVARSVS